MLICHVCPITLFFYMQKRSLHYILTPLTQKEQCVRQNIRELRQYIDLQSAIGQCHGSLSDMEQHRSTNIFCEELEHFLDVLVVVLGRHVGRLLPV